MSRAVTADHVLFNECIHTFRSDDRIRRTIEGSSRSYLLTSFHLPETWTLPDAKVLPSIEVYLPGAYSSFVCIIENPQRVGIHNPHHYGLALAAIISFVMGRPCQSTRDDHLCHQQEVTEYDLRELAIQHPILVAGPGGISPRLSQERLDEYMSTIKSFINTLHSIPFKKYVSVMQAVRLVHLSILNKRNDFGLAYLLLISAIESIAQQAINRKRVKKSHDLEQKWKTKATSDQDFAELLTEYHHLRGQNSYLKERYVQFINTYAPSINWDKIILHRNQEQDEYYQSLYPEECNEHLTNNPLDEISPQELSMETINKILEDSYKHRSCFIHRGEQPPHNDPESDSRFFQEVSYYEDTSCMTALLPNYTLLLGIAQHSIIKWAME